MRILLILMFLVVAACASSPTGYVPSKDKKGYSDQTIDSDLRLASFQGSSTTTKENAELFAKFRAIEVCKELNKAYGHILMVKDRTFSKEVAQASTTNNYYGMSPYYGRYGAYGGTGFGMSYGASTTTVSSQSYTYPMFDVYFECVDKPLDARISLSTLSSSQMQPLIKDLQGAVQVEDVLSDSPNAGKLQKADIVIKVGGERVTKVLEVFQVARKNQQKDMKVELFRNGVKKETVVRFLDVTELVAQAQAEIIKAACKIEGIKDTNKLCK